MKKCDTKYFSQICKDEFIILPCGHPDIEQIVSAVTDFEIISLKAVNTMKGSSYEGQYLSGKKLVVEFKLRQKILYTTEKDTQSVHILENESFQCVYIVIPCFIKGTDPELLIRHKMLRCKIDSEDIFINKADQRKIYINLCLLVRAEISPVCEIGCSIHYNCAKSNISIMHIDGTHSVNLTNYEDHKNYMPLWSPTGQEIACISDVHDRKTIYIYNLKFCYGRHITGAPAIKSIGSFCWSADGSKLFFSGLNKDNCKEIFSICSNNTGLKNLTLGNGIFESYMPKAASCGNKIAFLRSFEGLCNLWVMNPEGTDCTKLTACDSVKYFEWSPDGSSLIYICSKDSKPDEICIYNTELMKNFEICIGSKIARIRKTKFSSDGRSIAFIGTQYDSEDIYVYSLAVKKLMNLTQRDDNIKISDFVWNADSDIIYYTANELAYCNIYSINTEDKFIRQLTNTTASKIELTYRPKIV